MLLSERGTGVLSVEPLSVQWGSSHKPCLHGVGFVHRGKVILELDESLGLLFLAELNYNATEYKDNSVLPNLWQQSEEGPAYMCAMVRRPQTFGLYISYK